MPLFQFVPLVIVFHCSFVPLNVIVKPVQLRNTYKPILVTLLGIVIEVKPLQSENAYWSMLVTLLGIVTEVKPVQP